MRRTLPLMLALVVAIAVMVIVNLFIGSVKIPVGDICSILVGQGSENEIWTNIIQRCQPGRRFCRAVVRTVGWGSVEFVGLSG